MVLAIGGALTVFLWIRRPREWPWDPASPTAGRLARENTARNPGRTAVTSAALMIGVALIVFVADLRERLQRLVPGRDRSIDHQRPDHPGPELRIGSGRRREAANQVPGVKTASGLQFTEAKINNGGTDVVNGVDPASFSQVYKFDWLNGGSNSLLTNLGSNQALIEEQFAKSHDLSTGDSFTLTGIDGNKLHLDVAGEYKDPNLMTGLIIPSTTFDKFAPGNKDPGIVLVEFDQGPQGDQPSRRSPRR